MNTLTNQNQTNNTESSTISKMKEGIEMKMQIISETLNNGIAGTLSVRTKARTLGLLGLAGLVAMASVVGTASADSPDSNVGPGSYTSDHFGFMDDLTENARLIEASKISSELAVKINPSLKPHFSVHGPGFIDVAAPTVNTSLKTAVADKNLAVQINPSLNRHYSVTDSAFNDIAEPTVRGSVRPTSGVHSPGFIDVAAPTVSGTNAVVKVDGPFTYYANGFVSSEMDAPTLNIAPSAKPLTRTNPIVRVDGPFTYYANGYVSGEVDAPTINVRPLGKLATTSNPIVKVDGPFTYYANGYVSSEVDAPTMNTGR